MKSKVISGQTLKLTCKTLLCGYIRPMLDYGVPVFNGSLTVVNCCSLETIQKRACRIMLGDAYITYKTALEKCTLVTLN